MTLLSMWLKGLETAALFTQPYEGKEERRSESLIACFSHCKIYQTISRQAEEFTKYTCFAELVSSLGSMKMSVSRVSGYEQAAKHTSKCSGKHSQRRSVH